MNKKNTTAIIITIIASTGIIATSAFAFFNAQQSFINNKLAAGTLDLNISSETGVSQQIAIDNIGSQEDISGSKTWKVKNSGSLPGKLIVSITNLKNLENGCNTPEITTEPNCETDNIGELGNVIILDIITNNQTIASSSLANDQATNLENQLRQKPLTLEPGQEIEITTSWHERPEGYSNEIQSDTVNFDLSFRLEQQ